MDLDVVIERYPVTTYTYSYWFKDSKGFRVVVEGFPSIKELEKDLKRKLKMLPKDKYNVLINKNYGK